MHTYNYITINDNCFALKNIKIRNYVKLNPNPICAYYIEAAYIIQ